MAIFNSYVKLPEGTPKARSCRMLQVPVGGFFLLDAFITIDLFS